ncbi:MAG: PAC2 family protein [Aigarchaeota archaeon]|nr:PAC2 family protein [Aigarchaeota archaeon]MCX8192297.1 PAC2 family protein [Nitrososphaeria archaeon]MDW7986095.1 PAC2 family protein [Nitrososphaerota archaeon]
MIEVFFEPGAEDLYVEGATLIEGLPGVGLVAKVSVAYMLGKLEAKKVCRLYSSYFPSLLYAQDGKLVPSFADLYVVEKPVPLIFLYGNSQPASSYGQHELCEKVLDIVTGLGATFVMTLGGYGKDEVSEVREVYISSTRPETIQRVIKKIPAKVYGGQIVGAAGLLITLAEERGLDNLSMLIEASQMTPDYYAARRSIESVNALLDLGLKIGDVDEISKTYISTLYKIEF